MASMVTRAPFRSSNSSNFGMAVISLDLPSTATCPRVRCCRVAQALTRCSGPRPAARRCRVPQRLAVDGDVGQAHGGADRPDPTLEARPERGRIQAAEDPLEGVVRRHPVGQVQEAPEPRLAVPHEDLDILPAVAIADDGADRHDDEVQQLVPSAALEPRILEGAKVPLEGDSLGTDHGLVLRVVGDTPENPRLVQ